MYHRTGIAINVDRPQFSTTVTSADEDTSVLRPFWSIAKPVYGSLHRSYQLLSMVFPTYRQISIHCTANAKATPKM